MMYPSSVHQNNYDVAYNNIVSRVLFHGTRKENRTGVDTLSTFGHHYNIDLHPQAPNSGFPLLTSKKMKWSNIVIELLWFLSGDFDVELLQKHGIKFWDPWVDDDGRVPSAYGYFWRFFDDPKKDQIKWVIDQLKTNPMSRRMVVSAWNPYNAHHSKLPPCHVMFCLNVQTVPKSMVHDEHQTLNLHLTQRSCDVALGVPYNIASYALLLRILAHLSNLTPGVFSHTLVDAHIYTSKPDGSMEEYDHVPGLKEQISREPYNPPQLNLNNIHSLKDVEDLIHEDKSTILEALDLVSYQAHPAIKYKVAV